MSESAKPRKAGRPRRAALTELEIATTALELIDERGWSGCTMQALGARLGVRAPSLYHYVEGQQGIVDFVRSLIAAEIHDPAILSQPWDEAMRNFGTTYYNVFAAHPNTIQVLSTTPVRDATTLRLYETFLQTMQRAGWEGPRAFEALLGIEHLALGFAYEKNAAESMIDAAACLEFDAPLLAEVAADRTDIQAKLAESSYFGLLEQFIESYR